MVKRRKEREREKGVRVKMQIRIHISMRSMTKLSKHDSNHLIHFYLTVPMFRLFKLRCLSLISLP